MSGDTGKLLTIEGIEGVGKSTQIARLARALSDRGIPHVLTREPGGTPLAEQIRGLVLQRHGEALPEAAELLLMFAARAVHLRNLIEPNLAAGRWVLCDRFTDATYAYQGAGRGIEEGGIRLLENLVQGTRRPDLTLLIDVPVGIGLARARARNAQAGAEAGADDRFESERAEFFERVRQGYLARAAAEPRRIAVIDGTGSADEVEARIMRALAERAWIS